MFGQCPKSISSFLLEIELDTYAVPNEKSVLL